MRKIDAAFALSNLAIVGGSSFSAYFFAIEHRNWAFAAVAAMAFVSVVGCTISTVVWTAASNRWQERTF